MRSACLFAVTLFACTSDPGEPGSDSPDIYMQPCDLSPVATIDQTPGDLHIVVQDDNHLLSGALDVTSIVRPVLCAPIQIDAALDSLAQDDWVMLQAGNVVVAIRGAEIGDGDTTRLVYEMRQVGQVPDALYIVYGEILRATRSWAARTIIMVPGNDLELATSLADIEAANPAAYKPVTYTYTFR